VNFFWKAGSRGSKFFGSCVLVFGCCVVKFGVLCCANLCGSWNLEGVVLLGVGAVKQGAILWTRGVRSVGEKKK
jgi:hypothetical protein